MRTMRALVVGFVMVMASGCAQRADWIEGTLVTVDVTGRWAGTYFQATGGGSGGVFDMTLRQTGPKATGDVRLTGPNVLGWSGPVDGTVSGDVLKFSRPDGRLRGEVTVAGKGVARFFSSRDFTLKLQRQPRASGAGS